MSLTCYCHAVPRGKRCLNCYLNWRAAGGMVTPASVKLTVVEQTRKPDVLCIDCSVQVVAGPRCLSCAAVLRNKTRTLKVNRERRKPLLQRYGVA